MTLGGDEPTGVLWFLLGFYLDVWWYREKLVNLPLKCKYMMENQFYIPVDRAIEDFRGHLLSHDRTILSAKFGDGKTFFLTKFLQDEQVKRDYKILTLYPVNYQVAENRDVFELIKYDLLMQMLVKGMIEPEFECR